MRFTVPEYRKRDFSVLFCLKKEVGEMAIFGPKAWVNPFGKMSILRLFDFCGFFGLESRFFVLEYRKRHFPGPYCLKKKLGKVVIFVRKPWVNPLE